ncbi:MAG TPA: YbhN family protein [Gemmatimonadaceae bacterium]
MTAPHRAPRDHVPLPHIRWRSTLVLLVLLGVSVNILLPQIASVEAAAGILRRSRWWAVLLAALAQVVSYWGNGYTVRAVARLAGDRLSMAAATELALAAGSVGLVAGGPLGYAAATVHWARARGTSHEGAVLCGWLPGIMNTIMLVVLGVAGVVSLVSRHALTGSHAVTLALLSAPLAVLVLALVWVAWSEPRLASFTARARRLWASLRRRPVEERAVAEAVARITTMRRLFWGGGWRRPLAGAAVNAGFDLATLYELFVATRATPSLATLLAGYALPLLFGRVTFLPAGIGVTEGGMVGLYVAAGVPSAIAVLVVLAYRGLSLWLPTFVGVVIGVLMERRIMRGSRRVEGAA